MKTQVFVIKDKTASTHNGITKKYIDANGNNTSLLSNAKWYNSEEEAQNVIDENSIEPNSQGIFWSDWAYVENVTDELE